MRVASPSPTRWRVPLLFVAALAVAVAGVAVAKPGPSHPLQVTAVDPYAATLLFSSDQLLPEAQTDLQASIDTATMLYGLEVDHLGGCYALYHAQDSGDTVWVPNSDLQASQFSGLLYWDGSDVRIVSAEHWTYDAPDGETYDEDNYLGSWMHSFDRVANLGASAAGPVAEGDLLALRWRHDDPATEDALDDIVEVVHLRPTYDGGGAFSGLVELAVLFSFPQAASYGGRIAADAAGGAYISIPSAAFNSEGRLDRELYHLTYDAGSDAFVATDIAPAFGFQAHIEADDDGNLYVLGANWGDDDGVIFQRVPGGSYLAYASYAQTCCIEAFRAWAHDAGVFSMAIRQDKRGDWYVAPIVAGQEVAFAERMADTSPYSVQALSGDANGDLYVLHIDRLFIDNTYEFDKAAVYRLTNAGGGDGGDGGGGGPPPGKGKNK